mgnify:CR=1 FL=1
MKKMREKTSAGNLDETIRNRQLARKEAAAALEKRKQEDQKKTFVKLSIKKTASSLR